LHEHIGPDQYLKMPYYEFMWFAKEWIEFIDAKIKRHQQQEAEAEAEKRRMNSQMTSIKSPKMPKFK